MKSIIFNDKKKGVVESCLTKLAASYVCLALVSSNSGTVFGDYCRRPVISI